MPQWGLITGAALTLAVGAAFYFIIISLAHDVARAIAGL